MTWRRVNSVEMRKQPKLKCRYVKDRLQRRDTADQREKTKLRGLEYSVCVLRVLMVMWVWLFGGGGHTARRLPSKLLFDI